MSELLDLWMKAQNEFWNRFEIIIEVAIRRESVTRDGKFFFFLFQMKSGKGQTSILFSTLKIEIEITWFETALFFTYPMLFDDIADVE